MRRRSFLAGAVGATAGVAGCADQFASVSTTTEGSEGPDRLHVEETWLADPDGERVTLRGVNVVNPWWGETYADTHGKGFWDTVRLATDETEGWYTDVIRVPVPPDMIAEVGLETMVEAYLDRIVELARERGVYVLLDYHAVARYDTTETDTRLREFWNLVAPRYAEERHVLYELFNEPTRPAGDGLDSWLTWRETAQPWVDLLRDHAPETPIVVGSPGWSSMVRFAPEAPFDGDNLLYTAHLFPSWGPADWEQYFGAPALEVPVFVNEWGYIDAEREGVDPHMVGTTDGWGRPFREWLEGHPNVNWCAWSFSSEWLPVMFDHDWNLLGGNDYMGEFVKEWLADAHDAGTVTTATTTGPPDAPTAQIAAKGEQSITVAWEGASAAGETAIAQYRVTVGDRDPLVLRATRNSVEITDLSPGETYDVRVVAVDANGRASDPTTLTVSTASAGDPVLSIPRAPATPTIDAAVDELWSQIPSQPVDHWLWGEAATDLRATWRACWDDQALYVLVSVTDDDVVADRELPYRNDSVELYLDLDNSRAVDYDGHNDLHAVYVRGRQWVVAGTDLPAGTDPIDVATAETDDGWRLETAIAWAPHGVTPSRGHRLGFDVHVADNEGGEKRDGKRTWFAETDDSWEDPRSFAVVELAGVP